MRVYDVVGVGFGPSGLALAVALDECEHLLDCVFIERSVGVCWHEGMLMPDSRMQISCLKDLATLRNPYSRFTFLQYLKTVGRLNQFINLETLRTTRAE